MCIPKPTPRQIDTLFDKLSRQAKASGYFLNPDTPFTRDLVKGLLTNEERYGYWACPCRLADGTREMDRDIICPCDYRDADISEHGRCYCALYVSPQVADSGRVPSSIPERRPPDDVREKNREESPPMTKDKKDEIKVWRCRVCGYLCGRETPPEICPICKAGKDRFETFPIPA